MKLCEHCQTAPATVQYTKTVGGKTTHLSLCPVCASKLGLGDGAFFGDDLFFTFPFFASSRTKEEKEEICPLCKRSLSRIRQEGKFGCSTCFDTFAHKLDMTPFVGSGYRKVPSPHEKTDEETKEEPVSLLKSRLKKAVEEENYELAAKLRDEIRRKEEKGCTGTN